LLARLVG